MRTASARNYLKFFLTIQLALLLLMAVVLGPYLTHQAYLRSARSEADTVIRAATHILSRELAGGSFFSAKEALHQLVSGGSSARICLEIDTPGNETVFSEGPGCNLPHPVGRFEQTVGFGGESREVAYEIRVSFLARTLGLSEWITAGLLALGCGLVLLGPFLFNLKLSNRFLQQIDKLLTAPDAELAKPGAASELTEVTVIREKLRSLRRAELNLISAEIARQRAEERSLISRQIIHDIRSPLAALGALEWSLRGFDQELREIAGSVLGRIKAIVARLDLPSEHVDVRGYGDQPMRCSLGFLSSLVGEKQLLLRMGAVRVFFSEARALADLFVVAEPTDLPRIISNLIDNSIDAVGTDGNVEISVDGPLEGFTKITIKDDGMGMDQGTLDRLGEVGFSSGSAKKISSGSGLGVAHAIKSISSWGGKIVYQSKPSIGTTVEISLRCAE